MQRRMVTTALRCHYDEDKTVTTVAKDRIEVTAKGACVAGQHSYYSVTFSHCLHTVLKQRLAKYYSH